MPEPFAIRPGRLPHGTMRRVKVTILDDWFDTLRGLSCFERLADHEVTVWNDHVEDPDVLAERLRDCEALVLIRERTAIRAPLLERLSAHRSRHVHATRDRRVVEHALEHAFLRGRRAHVGACARCDAPDPAADGVAPRGDLADGRRRLAPGEDPRDLRLRPDRLGGRRV